jgi:hypothetical protein
LFLGSTDKPRALPREIFDESADEPVCSLKVISRNANRCVSPAIYSFYKQVKNYVTKIQNFPILTASNRELPSSKDADYSCRAV